MDHTFEKRITGIATFYRYLEDVMTHLPSILAAKKSARLDEQFKNKLLLAVTQVNGCRYCSYLHTQHALESGMSESEIHSLLNGELGDVEDEESVALIFAQHYAETQARPDPASLKRLYATYGQEKSDDILAIIRAIMVGNIHGISLDLLQSRLRGKADPDSSLWTEISIGVGILFLVPFLLLKSVPGLLSKTKEKVSIDIETSGEKHGTYQTI